MNVILFDDPVIRTSLLPFTFTRPLAELRIGIFTIAEKWSQYFKSSVSYLPEPYLNSKFKTVIDQDNMLINGSVCPDAGLVNKLLSLPVNGYLHQGDFIIGCRVNKENLDQVFSSDTRNKEFIEYDQNITRVSYLWDLFKLNGSQIRADFELVTGQSKSCELKDPYTKAYNSQDIFLDEGAIVKAATLDAESGPIFLGKNSVVHPGAVISGPFALCEHAHVNPGAKIRGDSTVGPYSKAGGEISNSLILGYSNKAHDGFLGNSVIGEWCNIGADTNNSNLKNNYAPVKLWSYEKNGFVNTGEQFCGLFMGDHSKCGINTMFNTGTIVGVAANIFGSGFPRTLIPSFSWGGAHGFSTFDIEKVFEMAEAMMGRRNLGLTNDDKKILKTVFELTAPNRVWEKK